MITSTQNRQRAWMGFGLACAVGAIYILTFGLLYPVLGSTTNLLAMVLIAIVAWFSGLRGGLIAGLLTLLLTTILLGAVENVNWATALRQGIGVGFLDLVLFGAAFGQIVEVSKHSRNALFQHDQAIRESEERYRIISEATFDALILHENGVVIQANQATKAIFGYEPSELMGRDSLEILGTANSIDTLRRNIQAGFEEVYVATLKRKDGSTFEGEIHARNVTYQGRQVRVASFRDITERRQAEAALRESEANLRAILDNTELAYVLMDADMQIGRASCRER